MTRFPPMKSGTYRIASKFGLRGGGMHWGTDFAAVDGTKIYAAQAGTVEHIGSAQGFGQWIVIDHPVEAGAGATVYGHMWDAHATGLRQGDQVAANQHIAFVGNNGDSSGPHLHFEVHPSVWQPRTQLDPEAWLAEAFNPAEPPPSGQQPSPSERPEPLGQEAMLRQIHELLTTPVPSRSIYRDNDQPVDIWRGMLLNIDGMAHEAYIEREALLGFEPAIAAVKRCAKANKDPQARQRAAFILSKIVDEARSTGNGDGEVTRRPSSPRKAPAKKATKATGRPRRSS
jgi:murein DD-endopeptidase MepM/ murein hydrolase activator NlpD